MQQKQHSCTQTYSSILFHLFIRIEVNNSHYLFRYWKVEKQIPIGRKSSQEIITTVIATGQKRLAFTILRDRGTERKGRWEGEREHEQERAPNLVPSLTFFRFVSFRRDLHFEEFWGISSSGPVCGRRKYILIKWSASGPLNFCQI